LVNQDSRYCLRVLPVLTGRAHAGAVADPRLAPKAAVKAAEAAKAEAARIANAAKAEAAGVVDAAKAPDNTQAQGFIDKARTLVAEGKYSEAASALQELTGQTLSANQTTLVASLKEQIQKALAAGGVGDILKK
jgi:hypothetical protein